jgi:hypothetical protein
VIVYQSRAGQNVNQYYYGPQVLAVVGYDNAMDLNKMLAELRAERDQIEEAIIALGRLSLGAKRRGRPPLWMNQIKSSTEPKRRGRPPGSKNKALAAAE